MKKHIIVLTSIFFAFAVHGLQTSFDNDKFQVLLPNSNPSDTLQLVEWSTNLTDWESVARNFGSSWHNTFPNTETLTNVNGLTAHERDLTHPQVYYRLSSASSQALNNEKSVARFLQQATFGPTLSTINQFPGINSNDLNDSPYSNYATWIQQQINLPITSHRAFFRERSNPGFTANPSATKNGTSLYEVAYDPSKGPAFNYFMNGNVQQPSGTGSNLNTVPNNLGQVPSFVTWTSPNGQNTTYVEQNRYNDWLAKGLTYNPNDAQRGGGSIIDQKKIIWYTIAITAEDQLRQRMAWALSQIFVVGTEGSKHPQATERSVRYYDIFVRNAFGNYKDILEEVTYSPQMGYYLTYELNTKSGDQQSPPNDSFPDENYAREVMQLFTIGLWQLNEDGTFKYDSHGELIPTYNNENIAEFAKVFTGLNRPDKFVYYNSSVYPNYEEYQNQNYVDDMKFISWRHDYNPKIDLYGNSFVHPWGSNYEQAIRDDIDYVLEQLFQHDNTPPFVARQMIQRFTLSNPSPSYIYDVAQAFKNGVYTSGANTFGQSGDRGNLEAVIAAVLLHPEARTPALKLDETFGKLREPLIKMMSYARAFEIESLQTYGLFPFANLYAKLNQEPYMYPNVFNFYRPDFQPNGPVLDKDLNAPEFQPLTDVTTVGLPNALGWLIYEGITRSTPDTGIGSKWYEQAILDYTYQISLANDADALIDHLDMLVTAGRLTDENRTIIRNHINSLPSSSNSQKKKRVQDAIWLLGLTPEFNTLY